MARSTALAALSAHTIRRQVAPEPRRTLRDLIERLHELGPIRFRRTLTAPVLVWNAVTAAVEDAPGPRRPTKRVAVHTRDDLRRVAELAEQVWFLRSRSEFGPLVSIVAGRAPHCDVILNDYSVSQEHCTFQLRTWKGPPKRFQLELTDRDSLNGTTLEGTPVRCDVARVVRPGVPLEIGRLALTMLEPEELFLRVRSLATRQTADGG